MTRPTQLLRSSSLQVLHNGWMNLQVELHGKYSNQRLARLHAYTTGLSWLRIATVLLVTPLPCLVVLTLVDCLPLRAPSDGPYANYLFWIRNSITTTSIMLAITDELRTFLPHFPLSTRAQVGIALLASGIGVGQMFGFSLLIGFPAPFSHVIATPAVVAVIIGNLVWMWKDVLRANPSWWLDLIKYAIVVGTQVSLTVIYPAYVYIFDKLHGHEQALFVLVLPIIKMATKNIISRCLRGRDDIKPQGIILNVEIFNSLYVSMCMQTSTSQITIIVLMLVDFIQAWLSLKDMSTWITSVQQLLSKIPPDPSGSPYNLVEIAKAMIEPHLEKPSAWSGVSPVHSSNAVPAIGLTGQTKITMATATVHPVGNKQAIGRIFYALDSSERARLISLTKQILFATEFLILIEYTEVVIPIIYCVYISTIFYLPNRAFYPQTKNLDVERLQQMIRTVAMYSALELASFVIMVLILNYRLRLLGFHQLSFVLDQQWRFVQANFIGWTFYIVQATLLHFGFDFSMKFEWLKAQRSA